jgi:hypothetical protein
MNATTPLKIGDLKTLGATVRILRALGVLAVNVCSAEFGIDWTDVFTAK